MGEGIDGRDFESHRFGVGQDSKNGSISVEQCGATGIELRELGEVTADPYGLRGERTFDHLGTKKEIPHGPNHELTC